MDLFQGLGRSTNNVCTQTYIFGNSAELRSITTTIKSASFYSNFSSFYTLSNTDTCQVVW